MDFSQVWYHWKTIFKENPTPYVTKGRDYSLWKTSAITEIAPPGSCITWIVEWLSRLKLDLEAVVEDASDEVCSFEIQRSLIYLKFVWIVENLIILLTFPSESLSEEDYIKKSHCTQLVFESQQ